MIVNPIVLSNVGWTSISSEESKNRIMRAPPMGASSTFVIPGIGNVNSILLLRGVNQEFFACAFHSDDDESNRCISNYPTNFDVSLSGYQNDQYTITINTQFDIAVDVIEYKFVNVFIGA